MVKYCSKCGKEFPATKQFFYAHKRMAGGLNSECKGCTNIRNARYKAEHYEAIRAYQSEYRAANREKSREYKAQYYAAHREQYREMGQLRYAKHRNKMLIRNRAYYRANRDTFLESCKQWKRNNADKVRAYNRNRRARSRSVEGSHTAADIDAQLKHQKGLCYYCKQTYGAAYHVDHVIPLSRGGSNDPSNLVIACASCNLSKANRPPHEWPEGGRLL